MMHGLSIRGILLLGALILTTLLPSPMATAQSQKALSLMPWPSSVQQGSGELRIDASFAVALTMGFALAVTRQRPQLTHREESLFELLGARA